MIELDVGKVSLLLFSWAILTIYNKRMMHLDVNNVNPTEVSL